MVGKLITHISKVSIFCTPLLKQVLRMFIWMEGTDADCVNNAAAEDPATYNVNVKLAGISAE